MNCPAMSVLDGECMSTNPQRTEPSELRLEFKLQEKPKTFEGDKVPHGSKDQEIENLKRLLANVSQRLDALKTR